MTDSMVERVARAIYESKLFQPARADDPWNGKPTVTKAFCRDAARAAIEAMREPTEAMSEDGREYVFDGSFLGVWQSMIDKALSEKP